MPYIFNIGGIHNIGFFDTFFTFVVRWLWLWRFTMWFRTCWESVARNFVEVCLAVLKSYSTKCCTIFCTTWYILLFSAYDQLVHATSKKKPRVLISGLTNYRCFYDKCTSTTTRCVAIKSMSLLTCTVNLNRSPHLESQTLEAGACVVSSSNVAIFLLTLVRGNLDTSISDMAHCHSSMWLDRRIRARVNPCNTTLTFG